MSNLYLDSSGVATNSGSSDSNSPDLSGTADATAAANKTFVDGDVNTGTDQVALAGHGFLSGTGVELTTSGTLPAGLTLTTLYYLRAVDANTLTLHTNVADAIAGTNPVNITAAAGGGTHTINNRTINLGGSPNLSGVKVTHCRVTTTGTSHVLTMAGGVHGLANGNPVLLEVAAGGTMPGGVTAALVYWANVLSTSNTLRIYTTKALAIAGGASDVNVTSAEVRSLHVRADSQAAINVANSTVTNRKIFWIKAVDNTNKLVIIDGTLTVSGASNWAIGGQVNAAGCVDLINAVRHGDIVTFNTDISGSINANFRQPGGWSSTGMPRAFLRGKAGARRLWANTGNGTLFDAGIGAALGNIFIDGNLELQSQGTGSALQGSSTAGCSIHMNDVRITDSGASIKTGHNGNSHYSFCEFAAPIDPATNTRAFFCYFHPEAVNGHALNQPNVDTVLIGCLLERSTLSLLQVSVANVNVALVLNTFYRADVSGYIETSRTQFGSYLAMILNIFKDCGDAATEANIRLLSDVWRPIVDRFNLVSNAGARGGSNVLGMTLDASDLTADPLFVDPDDAGGAASRDFGLQAGSPAKGVALTFPGSASVSYFDIGAVQRQEAGGGASMLVHPGMAGGMRG